MTGVQYRSIQVRKLLSRARAGPKVADAIVACDCTVGTGHIPINHHCESEVVRFSCPCVSRAYLS